MRALLTVLGLLLCSLLSSSEVTPQADFSAQGVAGKWFLIGFATNAPWFVSHRSSMKMGTAVFVATADGDLDVSYASLNPDGSCWRMNNFAQKTDVPGKFTYKSESLGNDIDMRMVEVKYDEYALTHTIKTKDGISTVINKLYGRNADLRPDLVDKFRQFSMETGITPENIAILPKNDECPPA